MSERRPDARGPQTRRRKSLSDKQLAILEVIQRSIARHGYPPSMREIGDAVGLKSLSSVTHQLNQLELSGYLRRDAGKTRAMEVLIDLPGTSTENPADIAPRRRRRRHGAARRTHRRRRADHRRAAGRGDLPAPPPARRQGRPVHAQGLGRVDDRRRDLRRRLGGRPLAARPRRTATSSRRCSTTRRRSRPSASATATRGCSPATPRSSRSWATRPSCSARSWRCCAPSDRRRRGDASRARGESPDPGGMRARQLRHDEGIRIEEASCLPLPTTICTPSSPRCAPRTRSFVRADPSTDDAASTRPQERPLARRPVGDLHRRRRDPRARLDRRGVGAGAARRGGRVRQHPRTARGRSRRAGDDHRRDHGGHHRRRWTSSQLTSNVFDGIADLGLPPRAVQALGLLQAPAADGLENLVTQTVTRVVESDAFADVWATATRAAHRALTTAATSDGGGLVVKTDEGVGIQLGAIVDRVKANLTDRGLGVAQLIPTIDKRRDHRRGQQPHRHPHRLRDRGDDGLVASGHHARAVRPRHPARPPPQHGRPGHRHRSRDRLGHTRGHPVDRLDRRAESWPAISTCPRPLST